MKMRTNCLTLLALALGLANVHAAAPSRVPAGAYTLDHAHATLLFRVDHLGFSHYTARFKKFEAALRFDPQKLTTSSVDVTVDAASIETDFPHRAISNDRSLAWLMAFRRLARLWELAMTSR
jgi:polyisoprenoid-binding protein YceI